MEVTVNEVEEAVASIGTTYYASIGEAIDAAVDGDTIQVYAGTYEYTTPLLIENKSLTIVGEAGAIINGGLIASTTEEDKSITISALEFTTAGLEVDGYDNVTISGNTFTNITSWTEGQLAEGSADAIYVHGSETGTATITNNTIAGVRCNDTNVGDGMGITVLDLDNVTITGNTISDTWHNSINIYQNVAGDVVITDNTLSNWDSNRDAADDTTIGDGCEGGRALRIDLSAGATITVTGNTITPNDYTDRVDPQYVKITGVDTGAVVDLITQLERSNTWTDDPDFAVVILVNNEVNLLARVNASQLRKTPENGAVDEIGDMLTEYFGLDATGDSLTEIISLFWFDNYHYQNKFTFASLEDVESALEAVEEEYAKIIATFQGTGGYATNAEAVESYLSSALRLAKTSAGYNSNTWLEQEIEELAGFSEAVTASETGATATISDPLKTKINNIAKDESIDTLADFFAAFQAALEAEALLERVNASQLRKTPENGAVDEIGDMLTEYFGLDATGDSLTEIISLFWFDNYHYQNKFTFASLEDVESALEAVEEEYAKIIATFRGSEGEKYNNNVEAVESYLASAARLAATSSGDQTVADEIVELAPMYAAGIIGADNSINDAYEEMMNGIHSSEIDTLAEFLVAFQAALEAAPGD